MTTKTKNTEYSIHSPDGGRYLTVWTSNEHISYMLKEVASDRTLITESVVAMYTEQDENVLRPRGELSYREASHDETWEQPWGEERYIRNHYTELVLDSANFTMRFRLFNEGIGFRYEIKGEGELAVRSEETEFNIGTDSAAWWIPALGQNHYEHLYKKSPISEIDTAHTPFTIELASGGYAAIHEAALYDYGAMNLVPTEVGVKSKITPRTDGLAARVSLPFTSPWRTMIFAKEAKDLNASRIMLNLNEPSKIKDTSWIQPTKFMGIWWAMFIEYFTWASGDKHGATTANAIRYINAAKRLGISALLIEGWNETWDGDWTKNGSRMNHMQPYPDFDIRTVTQYAQSQHIDIVGHHETSGNISHYEWELPEAYDYYGVFGVRYIKTGYVAPRLDTGDFHSSQIGVRHYQKTVELAAERKIMLDIHEPVKGTGIERTWPNLMTREGVMGQEYEGGAVSPEHATVLPFTRLLAGPLDYTPGLFNLNRTSRKVQTTLGKQLAFYVTMYSPMQMVADLPEHYEGHPAFEFIRHVSVDWEKSVSIDGVIGDYFIQARKDRNSDDWYIGGVTDEEAREVQVPLSFLQDHRTYRAVIYRDAADAHWQENPEAYEIESKLVTSNDELTVRMAPGGGFAVRLQSDGETPQPYPV